MSRSIAAAAPAPLVATIQWGSVVPLLLTALAVMGSPGPATISLTAAASAYGVRRSLGYLIGLIVGTATVLVGVATGITATLLAVPAMRSVLIAISAAYVLWLAYHIATAPPPAGRTATSAALSLIGGTLLGVANPKAWGRHRRRLSRRSPRRCRDDRRGRQGRRTECRDRADPGRLADRGRMLGFHAPRPRSSPHHQHHPGRRARWRRARWRNRL